MDDMISRQAAIKAFKDFLTIHDSRGAEYLCSAVTMDGVNRILSDLPSVQPEHLVKESGNLVKGLVNDCISRKAAIDALEREKTYSAVYKYGYTQTDYFKQYSMGLTDGIKALNKLPSAQPEQIARDIATIIENEQDMRVILQNEERTETHSCDYKRTETHDWIPVSEALPEDACQCIVTAKVKHVDNYPDYEVDTADFADGIFTTANSWWGVESIIAWMPLPQPYKEGLYETNRR